jgi:hypothetical protein
MIATPTPLFMLEHTQAAIIDLFDNNDADTQLWHAQAIPFYWSWLIWSISAASYVGLVPGGLELASTAAASACGLVIAVLEAINCT